MLRALSTLESFYVAHDINIITVTDLKGSINALLLQKAIETVVMSHPLLSSEVLQTEAGYIFSQRASFDDKLKVIGEVDKDKRKQIIQSELNKPLGNNSLVRFTLLLEARIGILKSQEITLITTTHHAVSDGVSSIALQEQLWKTYAEIASNHTPTITPHPLMPAIETLIPTNFTPAELTDYIERYAQIAKNHTPFTLKPADLEEGATVEINYVRKKFTLKQTETILSQCKARDVSVHGVICAANLLALKDIFGTEGQLDLSCHSPIDIRARLEPAVARDALFSAAVGCTHVQHITADDTLQSIGEAVSATITNHIDSGDLFKSMLTYQETRLTNKLPSSIGITNVGSVNTIPISHKLKFQSIQLIPRIPLPLLTASVITSGDKLTITYSYAKPFYSGNTIKKIAEQAAINLLGMIENA